jgi:transglutaminase superfamily protein
MRAWGRFLAACALPLVFSACGGRYFHEAGIPPDPPPRYALADLPMPEHWTGVVFNGAKVGFTHTRVARAAQDGLYDIHGEAVIRFRFLGYDKRTQIRTLDTVDENARLVRFDYRYVLDESEQSLTGEVRDGRLRYRLTSAGRAAEQKEETLTEPLYPAAALDLLPVLGGLRVGSAFRWLVFNGETQNLSRATQRVESYEASDLFEGAAFKVQTELLGLRSTSWIDARGRPLLELGMNGVLVSALEDERAAKSYLASAAVNKDDVLVAWSLVKTPLPIADPRRAQFLRVALNRMPLSDERQRCRSSAAEAVCEIDAGRQASPEPGSAESGLKPSAVVQSNDPMIRLLARSIAPDAAMPVEDKIGAVLGWLAKNIRKEPVDAFSALDVLDARRGECQGHAYLYAALARALGVPTRVVNGLVYTSDYAGFLYHTWAESLVAGSWRAVDPTFAQAYADATHIALARGESPADLAPLVDWVGNTHIRVLEARQGP